MHRILCLPLVLTAVACSCTAAAAELSGGEIDMFFPPDASSKVVPWEFYCEDPDVKQADVWKIENGLITCRGTPKGYIYTAEDYTNFVLKLEWRWPPGKKPGNGGVLVRMTGKNKIWPKSLEAQINVGNAGDFWGLDGYKLSGPAERTKSLVHPRFGKLINVKKLKPVEKPPGEWNQYEITVDGDKVTLVINGRTVNRATGCDVLPGKIVLTAEGDEIQFRNVRLTPVVKK